MLSISRVIVLASYLNKVLAFGFCYERLKLGSGESVHETGLGHDEKQHLGAGEDGQLVCLSSVVSIILRRVWELKVGSNGLGEQCWGRENAFDGYRARSHGGDMTNLLHDTSLALGEGDVSTRLVLDELDLNLATLATRLVIIVVVVVGSAGTRALDASALERAIAILKIVLGGGRVGLVGGGQLSHCCGMEAAVQNCGERLKEEWMDDCSKRYDAESPRGVAESCFVKAWTRRGSEQMPRVRLECGSGRGGAGVCAGWLEWWVVGARAGGASSRAGGKGASWRRAQLQMRRVDEYELRARSGCSDAEQAGRRSLCEVAVSGAVKRETDETDRRNGEECGTVKACDGEAATGRLRQGRDSGRRRVARSVELSAGGGLGCCCARGKRLTRWGMRASATRRSLEDTEKGRAGDGNLVGI